MINLLGPRIVFVIVLATVFLSGMGALSYYYMAPELSAAESQQRTLRGQISNKRADIAQLKEQYVLLKDQILKFNLLKKKGFFNAQDRVTARETIRELTDQARILKADLALAPAIAIQDKNAENANHVLISGPMSIKIKSINDVNVLKYMVALQNIFPGYLEFKDFSFHRVQRDRKDPFANLMKGTADSLIEGELQFVWWSMASPEQMAANPYFNPTGVVSSPIHPKGPPLSPVTGGVR